jgi:putative transposase
MLRRRIFRVPARRRPYYRPWERLEILWHRARYRLSLDQTAAAFALTRNTILNWETALRRGDQKTVGAKRTLARLPDLVRELTERLKFEWPDWGTRRIAGVLAQMGVRVSRTTVQRILRSRGPRPAPSEPRLSPPVTPYAPGEVWLADFTRLSNGFRTVWVGAVIDAFSRRVLALAVAPKGPTARTTLQLLRHARSRHGCPRWFVTDQGPEFTAKAVERWSERHDVRHRLGAVGRKGSIARMERFWRSMKCEYARGLLLYVPRRTMERRLRTYVRWFNRSRPHQGLGQRTPDQIHFRRRRKATKHLERGRLEVHHEGGERSLPVLRLTHAA